jgi:zinc/manganese transport system ATP-binding protein
VSGTPDQVLTGEQLSALYGTRVDVARVGDHLVIVGAPNEPTGPHHGGAS